MQTVSTVLGWAFGVLFFVVGLALFGMGGWLQSALVMGIVLLVLPPVRKLERRVWQRPLRWWVRALVGVGLWGCLVASIVLFPAQSIYKSPENKARFREMYSANLAQWPVPHESRFIDTSYGKIHVIVSGPPEAPPVLLFHASGVAAWSWRPNIEALSQRFRTYAADNIGEVGLNEMLARDRVPRTPSEVGAYCRELADQLGVKRAHVVGASIGGYIATTFALEAPERVDRLVLLGPMGYGSTATTVVAMTLAQGFPFGPVQDRTFRWAFGDAEHVRVMFNDWFRLLMVGALPNPIPPASFTAERLQGLTTPTLIWFGARDGVIGDANHAKELAEHIPDAEVRIVDSGHLIGAELAPQVDEALLEFLP